MENYRKLLKKYVRNDQPFGPVDAALITEPSCSAALYDWKNRAFAEMIDGSDVLVGRRGSGKSSLIHSFQARQFLQSEFSSEEGKDFRGRYRVSSKSLIKGPDLIILAETPTEVNAIVEKCLSGPAIPLAEIICALWLKRIWWLVGNALAKHNLLSISLPRKIAEYIDDNNFSSQISNFEFTSEIQTFLTKRDIKVLITFDNVDDHNFREPYNSVLGGLIAATGTLIGSQNSNIDIKLCLPSEQYSEIRKLAFRPDKDLHRVQYLHWNAAELLHLAARRLKVYFSLYNPDEYEFVKDIKTTKRDALIDFWHRYLPDKIQNSSEIGEDTITYILRHTQMLPRQLISILNRICARRKGHEDVFDQKFSSHEIIKGIEDSEGPTVDAILFMFRRLYPTIDDIFLAVMPRLTREFSYGYLQKVWRESASESMASIGKPNFIQFWQLMLSTGTIGLKVDDYSSEIYSSARFEYNTKYSLSISDKDTLCVHPLFSRIYNLEKKEGAKLVLPRGSNFDVDRGSIW